MSGYKHTKYKGYEIVETFERTLPEGGVFVTPIGNKYRYLSIEGEIQTSAINAWYIDVAHAKQVIDDVVNPVKLGGE